SGDPVGHLVAAAHVRLHHAVDHEGRRYVDAVLSRIFGVPFDLAIEIWDGKRPRQLQSGITLDTPDDIVWRGVHVWSASMLGELDLLAMRRNSRQHGFRGLLAGRQG